VLVSYSFRPIIQSFGESGGIVHPDRLLPELAGIGTASVTHDAEVEHVPLFLSAWRLAVPKIANILTTLSDCFRHAWPMAQTRILC